MSLVRKHGGLVINIFGDSQMFGNKKNKQVDIERREVLKKGFKLGMAATGIAAAAQFMTPSKAQAGYSYQQYIDVGYPPGIADAATRHFELANLWDDLKKGDFSKFRRTLGFDSGKLGAISSNAWLEEPAFYFIGMHWREFDYYLDDDKLKKNNLAMKGFKDCMNIYLRKYSPYIDRIDRNPYWLKKSSIERLGIITLIESSNTNLNLFKNIGYKLNGNYNEQVISIARQYQQKDELTKKRTLNLITENLRSQNVINKRIANWTGYFLTLYFQQIEGKGENTMRYHRLIEKKMKEIYGKPVRGPPLDGL